MAGFLIRPVRADDVHDLNELRRQPSVLENNNCVPTEGLEETRKMVEKYASPNTHVLVAEVEGKMVGIAKLEVMHRRQAHVGNFGINVHDDYQGRGIGKALIEAILDLADNYLNLRRVQLDVWATNERAIRLYERYGFVVEGRKRECVFIRGEYVDILTMGRLRRP
ncbi:MAG: GNAT family N-acetyltransferase [Chitinophagales bacterium]